MYTRICQKYSGCKDLIVNLGVRQNIWYIAPIPQGHHMFDWWPHWISFRFLEAVGWPSIPIWQVLCLDFLNYESQFRIDPMIPKESRTGEIPNTKFLHVIIHLQYLGPAPLAAFLLFLVAILSDDLSTYRCPFTVDLLYLLIICPAIFPYVPL